MSLPTIDEIKAAYARHPEIMPMRNEDWGKVDDAGNPVRACPLSIVLIDRGALDLFRALLCPTYVTSEIANFFHVGPEAITGFYCGVDGLSPDCLADRRAHAFGAAVADAVFHGEGAP